MPATRSDFSAKSDETALGFAPSAEVTEGPPGKVVSSCPGVKRREHVS